MGKAVELDRELGAVQRKLRRQEEVHEEALRQCTSLQEQVLNNCDAAVLKHAVHGVENPRGAGRRIYRLLPLEALQ